ncbi:MAG TPA: PspA/IM30 family protein [Planktothrix sp.]|jgi:phage shock protein A
MFDRLKNIIKGAVNKGLDSAETPELLAEQAQEQIEGDVKKLRSALTDSLAAEKLIEAQMKKKAEEVKTFEQRAATALKQDNEDLAKQCLQRKQELIQQAQDQDRQLTEQKKATATLKSSLSEMEQKLQEFYQKKRDLIARAQAGAAVVKANELLSGTSPSGGMDKWEAKIREKEARSAGMAEASGRTSDDEKFKALDQSSQVDDELAALKASLNPKLIVESDASKKKEMVDDNVPMVVDGEVKDVT